MDKPCPGKNTWVKKAAALILISVLALGCSDRAAPLDSPLEDLPVMVQDGITLPLFPSAGEQLAFARSGLRDKLEKMAAFRAVLARFPNDPGPCGQASVGLAYLHLEPDYRFATPLEIQKAAQAFEDTLAAFSDRPEVGARSLWYLGWIHTTLQNNPEKGMVYFWRLKEAYPGTPMAPIPAAPWENLVYLSSLDNKEKKALPPVQTWDLAALLEIVRHSPDRAGAIKAFDLIMEKDPDSSVAGLAIKALLTSPGLRSHALPRVSRFLEKFRANPYLSREIGLLAQGEAP